MAGEDAILPIPIQLVLGKQGSIERESVTAVSYNFTISNSGKWEMLVSAGDRDIRRGEIELIPIDEVVIDENTVALPCAFCHHALGVVLKIQHIGVSLVETRRRISSVVFLPIDDGRIEKRDLLAVINVFPIIVKK